KSAVIHARVLSIASTARRLYGLDEVPFRFRREKKCEVIQRDGSMHSRQRRFRRRAQCFVEGLSRQFVAAERVEVPRQIITGVLVIFSQLTRFAKRGQGPAGISA